MTRRWLFGLGTIVVVLATVTTCKDSTGGPKPGALDVRLTSPNIDDGGLHFTIGGARIDSVTTNLPIISLRMVNDSLWHVVVGGNVGTGPIAKIWVPDTRHVTQYTGAVLEVVVRSTYAQRSATGYAIVAAAP